MDGQRYPRHRSLLIYEEKDYFEQYEDIKLFFFKDYVEERILNPPISHPNMKTKYPIGILGLRYQLGHITSEKLQLFVENGFDPDNARLFSMKLTKREIELINDGNKLIEVKVI